MLDQKSDPFAFSGDATAGSALIDGETTDVNVMTRRGVWRHRMRRIGNIGQMELTGSAVLTVLLFAGSAEISANDIEIRAETLDVVSDITAGDKVTINQADGLFVIELDTI